MPNRGELAIPARRLPSDAAAPDDVLAIAGFCAIGWLMSIYVAVSSAGTDAIPWLMAQLPWGLQLPWG
jgi:hypothetical protein